MNTNKMKEAIRKSYFQSDHNPKVKNLLTLIEKNLGYHLFQEVEKTKMSLTENDEAQFTFLGEGINFEEFVSIEEFETEIIAEDMNKISDYLDGFLLKNEVSFNAVDSVFMTGGTSMVRALKKMFVKKFGEAKIKSGDNFNSVAMGLAYSYAKFQKD